MWVGYKEDTKWRRLEGQLPRVMPDNFRLGSAFTYLRASKHGQDKRSPWTKRQQQQHNTEKLHVNGLPRAQAFTLPSRALLLLSQ